MEVEEEKEVNNNEETNKTTENNMEEEENKENDKSIIKPAFYIKTDIPYSALRKDDEEVSPNSPFHQNRNSLNSSMNDDSNTNTSPLAAFKEIIRKETEIKEQINENNNIEEDKNESKNEEEKKDGNDDLFKMFEV